MVSKLTNRLEALERHAGDAFWRNVKYDVERLTIPESCRLARLVRKMRCFDDKPADMSALTKAEIDEMVELWGRMIVED
jgi:hypothetical protein